MNKYSNEANWADGPSLTSMEGKETDTSELGYQWVNRPPTDSVSVEAQFSVEAMAYDDNMRDWGFLVPEQSTNLLLETLEKDAKILEAGCGTGLSDESHFKAGFKNLHGCDLSSEMLVIAQNKGIHKSLKKVDLSGRLPYTDNEFDAVICLATLTYIEDARLTLSEFIRITKPGGTVIFSQRDDLFNKRNMAGLCDDLESIGLWVPKLIRKGLPYVEKHVAYVQAEITVGYYVYIVQ